MYLPYEHHSFLDSLKRRASKLAKAFNELEGISCNDAEGAMYLFPTITLPPKAIEAAKKKGQAPDAFYTMELLNATGVCVVPGSGFHQQPGTFHFRTTILPPVDQIKSLLSKFERFHLEFLQKWN